MSHGRSPWYETPLIRQGWELYVYQIAPHWSIFFHDLRGRVSPRRGPRDQGISSLSVYRSRDTGPYPGRRPPSSRSVDRFIRYRVYP